MERYSALSIDTMHTIPFKRKEDETSFGILYKSKLVFVPVSFRVKSAEFGHSW